MWKTHLFLSHSKYEWDNTNIGCRQNVLKMNNVNTFLFLNNSFQRCLFTPPFGNIINKKVKTMLISKMNDDDSPTRNFPPISFVLTESGLNKFKPFMLPINKFVCI